MLARRGPGLLAVAVALGLALVGCAPAERPSTEPRPTTNYAGPPIGAPASASASAPGSAAPGAPAEPGAPAAPGAPGTAPVAPTARVSANTASEAELIEALTRAGVPTPERWAQEVIEYRPYPVGDPSLGTLRQNLAKYNPGQVVIDKIISALKP